MKLPILQTKNPRLRGGGGAGSPKIQASLSEPDSGPFLALSLGECVLPVYSLAGGSRGDGEAENKYLLKITWARMSSHPSPCPAKLLLTPPAWDPTHQPPLPRETWGWPEAGDIAGRDGLVC